MIKLMHPNVGKEELALVEQVLMSGNLVEGKMVKAFEEETCRWIGVAHGVACTSATTGLELALRALDVGWGDEVIIPGFTHPATALCVEGVGAVPVTVDVDPRSYNTNAEIIKKSITKHTKAIMPVSLFGNPLDMQPILDLGLPVVEDAACSLGSEREGRRVGSEATITVFSFHPRKVFTTGDGGLITTNDTYLAEKMRRIKRFGGFQEWGTNYRMSDILGAVALAQVRKIDLVVSERRKKAAWYDRHVPVPPQGSNYQSYVIHINDRDETISYMKRHGVECQVGTYALHKLDYFKNLPALPVSEMLHRELMALPLHHLLTEDDQEYIISLLMKKGGVTMFKG